MKYSFVLLEVRSFGAAASRSESVFGPMNSIRKVKDTQGILS
jgi:hypothetical protein